jgi:hypothetical protein
VFDGAGQHFGIQSRLKFNFGSGLGSLLGATYKNKNKNIALRLVGLLSHLFKSTFNYDSASDTTGAV